MEERQRGMRRGLVLAVVTALLAAFAIDSPALAQGTQEAKEYCADSDTTAYQYGCDEPRSPDCAAQESQQQYAEDGTGGCVVDPHQYNVCADDASCSPEQIQSAEDADSIMEALPPASVQNIVVAAANSVSEDAAEASRALETAEPVDPANNFALAAESEPVAEPMAYPSEEAPEEDFEDGAIPQPSATAPDPATAPAEPAGATQTVELMEATQPTKATEPTQPIKATEPAQPIEDTQPTETAEVVTEQERGLKEVYGDSAASDGNASVDQFVVPLFALGGSTLLIGGGLLVRRIVG